MSANSQHGNTSADGAVLRWNGRLLTAEDLRHSLNGQRELMLSPRAIVTPMAADHLKANGVRIVRQEESPKPSPQEAGLGTTIWGYAQESAEPLVESVIHSLKREGVNLKGLSVRPRPAPGAGEIELACGFACAVAECVVRHECQGIIAFCRDPGLVCCLANKVKGVRAIPASSMPPANFAARVLGANFLAVAVRGRTFFELRQTIRTFCAGQTSCAEPLATVLKELEGPCECQSPGQRQRKGKDQCHCGGGHAHR